MKITEDQTQAINALLDEEAEGTFDPYDPKHQDFFTKTANAGGFTPDRYPGLHQAVAALAPPVAVAPRMASLAAAPRGATLAPASRVVKLVAAPRTASLAIAPRAASLAIAPRAASLAAAPAAAPAPAFYSDAYTDFVALNRATNKLWARAHLTCTKPVSQMKLTMYVVQDLPGGGRFIAAQGQVVKFVGQTLEVSTDPTTAGTLMPGTQVKVVLQWVINYQDGTVEPGNKIINEVVLASTDPIVLAPVQKPGRTRGDLNNIVIGLARGMSVLDPAFANDDVDYWFWKNDVTKSTLLVPLVGSVKFSSKVADIGLNNPTLEFRLTLSEGGTSLLDKYAASEYIQYFSIDISDPSGRTVNFRMVPTPDQNGAGSAINFGTSPWGSNTRCYFTAKITCLLDDLTVETMIITSSNAPDDNPMDGVARIKPLVYVWHCLAAGTQILLADGTTKAVEDIINKDTVVSGHGTRAVLATLAQPHHGSVLVLAFANGARLTVSGTHPVITPEGAVQASSLKVGDKVLAAGGGHTTVQAIEEDSFTGQGLFNLWLDPDQPGETSMVANGIVVGDHLTQARLVHEAATDPVKVRAQLPRALHVDHQSWLEDNALLQAQALKHYWNFNEERGTIAADSAGDAPIKLNIPSWVAGKWGTALRFNPKNFVEATTGLTDMPPPWTICFWVKREAASSMSTLFASDKHAIRLEQYTWQGPTPQHRVGITKFNGFDESFVYTAPLNEWVHLALAATSTGTTKLFVNGKLHSSINSSIDLCLRWLGSTGSWEQIPSAAIDDIRVFDKVLSDDEVAEIGGQKPEVRNLIKNGSFEEGVAVPGIYAVVQPGSQDIQDWTVTGASVDYTVGSLWNAAKGSRSVDLNGESGKRGGIKQSFETTPGAVYTVKFALAGNPAGAPDTKAVRVQVTSSTLTHSADFRFSIAGRSYRNMGWEEKTWEFTAQDTTTTIEFVSLVDGLYGPVIDDVSVIQSGVRVA